MALVEMDSLFLILPDGNGLRYVITSAFHVFPFEDIYPCLPSSADEVTALPLWFFYVFYRKSVIDIRSCSPRLELFSLRYTMVYRCSIMILRDYQPDASITASLDCWDGAYRIEHCVLSCLVLLKI